MMAVLPAAGSSVRRLRQPRQCRPDRRVGRDAAEPSRANAIRCLRSSALRKPPRIMPHPNPPIRKKQGISPDSSMSHFAPCRFGVCSKRLSVLLPASASQSQHRFSICPPALPACATHHDQRQAKNRCPTSVSTRCQTKRGSRRSVKHAANRRVRPRNRLAPIAAPLHSR